jgi:hypothetical protein
MTIGRALYLDQISGADALSSLECIAQQLHIFKSKYPQTFRHLCEAALGTGEMTLGDAKSAFDWAAGYLAEGED